MPKKTNAQDARNARDAQKKLTVKQVRSGIGRPPVHRRTLKALGLKHHQDVTEVPDSPAVRGMLFQVRHLVEIQE